MLERLSQPSLVSHIPIFLILYSQIPVAEHIQAPVFTISAGDLGFKYWEVEPSLSRVLELCTKWNVVLIIKDAEFFLRPTTVSDLDRYEIITSWSLSLFHLWLCIDHFG